MTREGTSERNDKNAKARNQRTARYVGNQLIVKLKREFAGNPAARQQVIESLPGESTVGRDFDELGLAIINLPEGADPSAVAQEIGNHHAIEYAEPNFTDSGTER
jgi:hypothetical protein